jgi:hypothetical protein
MTKSRSALIAFLVLMIAPALPATSLVHLSLAQLSRASAVIVQGRAIRQACDWNADHSMIVTLTTIAVARVDKGSAAGTLVVEQPGGVMGNIQMRMDGTARFYPLASYVLFLESSHSDAGRFVPVGMMQGAFRIFRDADTGTEHVIPPVPGTWNETQRVSPAGPDAAPTLSRFDSRVQEILNLPMEIPTGVVLKVTVASDLNRGAGTRSVQALTMGTAFPDSELVIPQGSSLHGEALRAIHGWRIRWTSLDIRGATAKFAGMSEVPAGRQLNGAVLSVTAE